jgi:ABC-type enterobactin transport system permease subunit
MPAEDPAGVPTCYRHPDRETYIRCGRCDQPICTACAMLGPVGMRCKTCGKPAHDPLTSFTPVQATTGSLVAIVGGTIAAFIAARIGLFSIIVSYFAGAIVAEAVVRVVGYKHGRGMLAIVLGGILAGAVIGAGLGFLLEYGDLAAAASAAADEAGVDAGDLGLRSFLVDAATWAAISAGAACFGAWSRLR